MSKSMSLIFFVLILVLVAGMGFLGYLYSGLNDRYYVIQNQQMGSPVAPNEISKEIEGLKLQLKEQNETLTGLLDDITQISDTVALLSGNKYLAAPKYSLESELFQTRESANNTMNVTGSKKSITDWIQKNEIYLDYVLKKSLTLNYDRARKLVYVEDIVDGSLFYQMGFRKDDRILNIDGKVTNKGYELRRTLLELKDKRVTVLRGKKRVNLVFAYVDSLKTNIHLAMSKDQFLSNLPEMLSALSIEPAVKDGKEYGLKILNLDDSNVFSQMNLKDEDVITKINGDAVNQDKLMTAFKDAGESLELEYVRQNQPDTVQVNFSE